MALTPDQAGLLADLTLTLHVAYVLFVVGGQVFILAGWVLGWTAARNFMFRLLHLAAIGVVVIESWLGARCPLTVLENSLRRMAGDTPQELSFIGYWLGRLLFYTAPVWAFTLLYTLFAALVAASWLKYPPRRRRSARNLRDQP